MSDRTEAGVTGYADETAVRADWERRTSQRTGGAEAGVAAGPSGPDGHHAVPAQSQGVVRPGSAGQFALAKPASVAATPRTGHIELTWDLVPGAAGYVIERTEQGDAPQIVTHGGSDVAAVPGPPFADTGLADGPQYSYRIGAVPGAEYPVRSWSEPATARTAAGPPGAVSVSVDASSDAGELDRVWRMAGSERLSQLLGGAPGTDEIAADFAAALRLAREDLGVTMVRAHAILHDDNGVVEAGPGGALRIDFARVDAIFDRLLEIGLRPVVELSFMPAALARDPGRTVFTYRGIVSPPADWARWRLAVSELAAHLVGRYGIDEVAGWAFEVWNEPNLEVFWAGSGQEYLRLYDEAARAVKSADPRLRVGGPATAAGEWIEALAAHAARTGVPLDFVSSHTYGNLPLDLRPALRRHGLGGIPVWWTEWGIGATHFGPAHDSAMGAPFVLSRLRAAQGRAGALAYWVLSDHFEELGRPGRLFHDGFGLLTIGNLRKPRYWAVHLAEHLGNRVLESAVDGDGAGGLVQCWAARHDDGTVDVLVWNGTVNMALAAGDPRLDRDVALTVTGLPGRRYTASLTRVDEQHSNIAARCPAGVDWPDRAALDAAARGRPPGRGTAARRGAARRHRALPVRAADAWRGQDPAVRPPGPAGPVSRLAGRQAAVRPARLTQAGPNVQAQTCAASPGAAPSSAARTYLSLERMSLGQAACGKARRAGKRGGRQR